MNKYDQAYEYMTACFQSRGLQPQFVVSKHSMLRILQHMAQTQMDAEFANELFTQCPVNHQGHIKIDDLIKVIIRADQLLNEKIMQLNQHMQEQMLIRQEQQMLLQKSQQSTQCCKLMVNVIEARDLFQGKVIATNKPYVVIHCGQENKSTNLGHNDIVNPQWNQLFNFTIKTGSEKTYISVLQLDQNKKAQLLGEAHYSIAELQDQLKHNQWFNLYDQHGKIMQGSIHLELQFFTNEAKFYEESLNVLEQQIMVEEEEKKQYNNDLLELYKPFVKQNMIMPQKNIVQDAPQLMFVNELSKPIVYQGNRKVDLTLLKNPYLTDKQVNDLLNMGNDGTTTVYAEDAYPAKDDLENKVNYGYMEPTFGVNLVLILIVIYMAGSIYLCFLKSDMLNITLALLISTIIFLNYFDKDYLTVYGLLLILSSLMDLVWLAAYHDQWWDQHRSENPQLISMLDKHERWTLIDNYLMIPIKIILSCAILNLRHKMTALNEHNQFGIGQHLYHYNAGYINPFFQQFRTM